jgi:elongation factor G
MGEPQLELIIDRLRREFNVQATFTGPNVAYRETVTKQSEGEGRYVRQIGGRGHYAHVKIRLMPAEAGTGNSFVTQVSDDVIPREFIKAIAEGINEALTCGVVAGYPMSDVRVELYGGSFHEADSSTPAFKIAGLMALHDAARKAGPVALEPVTAVKAVVPEQYMGDVVRDLNSRRGRIEGIESLGSTVIVKCTAPLSELLGYANDLRSQTTGAASHSLDFHGYEALPGGPDQQDDDRIAPVVAPRRPPTRGRKSSVSLPEPDSE